MIDKHSSEQGTNHSAACRRTVDKALIKAFFPFRGKLIGNSRHSRPTSISPIVRITIAARNIGNCFAVSSMLKDTIKMIKPMTICAFSDSAHFFTTKLTSGWPSTMRIPLTVHSTLYKERDIPMLCVYEAIVVDH